MTTPTTSQTNPTASYNLTETVLRSTRRRLRLLGTATISLWILIALLLVSITLYYFTFIFPIQNEIVFQLASSDTIQPALIDRIRTLAPFTAEFFTWGACMIAVSLVAAALTTILFIRASNRANLNLIRAELTAISHQLRQLTQPQS